MAKYVKQTTNMVGMAVARAPRKQLIDLYNKTLEVLKEMPKDAMYRTHTEAITTSRLNMVEQEKDVYELEKNIGCGQIEEVIIQAKDELSLSEKMKEWEPWLPLETPAPENQWKWP